MPDIDAPCFPVIFWFRATFVPLLKSRCLFPQKLSPKTGDLMARAFLFVLDSFGIGGAPDASTFGDEGANTLGHIAKARAAGGNPLKLPNMNSLGLGLAAKQAVGELPAGYVEPGTLTGLYGNASERSKGKDTPSGHWEIAGVPVLFDWGYFPDTTPAFPESLTDLIIERTGIAGILGNCHASGTTIIEELGEEHVKTGKPICYTSADSVFQIAAHEEHFGIARLYALCETVRELIEPWNIGRVIARPFIGENAASFERTGNRHDYSVPPPEPTLLDRAKEAGRNVIAIGKIDDIYAHCGPTDVRRASGNQALFKTTLQAIEDARDGDLVFTNFVDFDMLYGHRRDVEGYAAALEQFDRWIPEFQNRMGDNDLLVLTADHGCDPTWRGTDHTREQVPVLCWSPGITPGHAGSLDGFAHIGESIAHHLGLPKGSHGKSFL